VVCYCRSWYSIRQYVEMPQIAYEALSERGKKLLSRYSPVDWA